MTQTLRFEIDFHGPVKVGTGRAGGGRDDTIDPDLPLPASTLKGLMRAECLRLFGPQHTERAFGVARSPSAWHWSDATLTPDPQVLVGARVRLDSDAGAAERGGLFLTEHIWPDSAAYSVIRMARLDPDQAEQQADVITASALSVHSIGADRTRGFGWVSVRRLDLSDPDAFLDRILGMLGANQ
jgi:CRISPR/Cas system CMR subunit Cmr4 (Cas7 group RAMP superfamily)